MIRKIISGGRTGVEQAALDVAIKLGISHGGWAARGMRNDEGAIEGRYGLNEMETVGFRNAMEQNVLQSDGTLLVTRGLKSVEGRYAVETALRHQKQFLHADLSQHSAFEASSLISSWASMNRVLVVFVTGPSGQQDRKIYDDVKKILETAIYLEFVKTGLHPDRPERPQELLDDDFSGETVLPQSVEEAVLQLKAVLPLKDRAVMANMQADELDHLKSGLGEYIKQKFGLYMDNAPLIDSCAQRSNLNRPLPDEACAVILKALWEDLRETHKLRIIK